MTSTIPVLTTHEGDYGPELWATPKPPEGARLVSYSELQSMDCWLKHHYAYHLRLKPVERFVALQLGSAWDAFYNAWHTNDGLPPATPLPPGPVAVLPDITLDPEVSAALSPLVDDVALERLAKSLEHADHELRREIRKVDGELADKGLPRPLEWDEQIQSMRTIVHGMALHYAARWGAEDDTTTLGVQVHFAVALPSASGKGVSNKYYLHGVLDRLAQDATGMWIVDAKLRMGTIEDDYRESFERDPQLALYGWAMREAGWPVVGGYIDASSAALPRFPQLKAQPETVFTDEVDAEGKPVPLMQPIPCEPCNGCGQTGVGDDVVPTEECAACDGEGVQRGRPVQSIDPETNEPMVRPILDDAGQPVTYKGGARAGEVKTEKVMEPGPIKMRRVTRPALYSGWSGLTTLPVALHAMQVHGLPSVQYAEDIDHLRNVWAGRLESRFHWRMDALPYTDPQLDRASASARGVAGYLDTLPPVPNPSKMKCKYCNFKNVCPSVHPVDFAEGFTTADQRREASERRRANETADESFAPELVTTGASPDLDTIF